MNVTVTGTTTTTKVSPDIRFDASYAKTIPGLIKIAQCVVSLIGFICIQMVTHNFISSAAGWYNFVAMTAFWVTLILIFGYIFHIIERLHWIPWLLGELIFCSLWAVFFFIAACIVVAKSSQDAGWGAAAFFGYVAMVLYGYEAFTKFQKWRAGETQTCLATNATQRNTWHLFKLDCQCSFVNSNFVNDNLFTF
ncbi:hypothetical protein JTE90_028352 [Oedothorax gibbosus]|uniref:MARVEL domain-containing protein n=1 Tax=Oedothorax gibbosus TaxID=931172 RepID=A0AAV6U0L3_9ARAC|nr:hypothetical protein JTE90_028352 [Oedothorax gibbosus]